MWAIDSISNEGWNLYNYLSSQGATMLEHFRDSSNTITPYTFIYKKNDFAMAEGRAESITDFIDHTVSIQGRWFEGTMSTKKIGPSTNWYSIDWKYLEDDLSENDTFQISLYGYNTNDEKILIAEDIPIGELDLSFIDADTMPFVSLEYYAKDVVDLSAIDLDYWRIYFEGTPELGIVTNEEFVFYKDTLPQGDQFSIQVHRQ